jgi:hypothetical protein
MSDEDDNGPQQRGYRSGGGLVPIPDPTKLTLEVVALAKREIEKLFDNKIEHLEEDIKRIATVLAELPNSKLLEQKFTGVATEFTMRDIALAAAFKAAEAAVAQQNASNSIAAEKLASAFTKQIDSLDEKIDDLKERISEIARKNWSVVGGYIVGAAGVAGLVAASIWHSPVH